MRVQGFKDSRVQGFKRLATKSTRNREPGTRNCIASKFIDNKIIVE
jgi:hypothetical protein